MRVCYEAIENVNEKNEYHEVTLNTKKDYEEFLRTCCSNYYSISIDALYESEEGAKE